MGSLDDEGEGNSGKQSKKAKRQTIGGGMRAKWRSVQEAQRENRMNSVMRKEILMESDKAITTEIT